MRSNNTAVTLTPFHDTKRLDEDSTRHVIVKASILRLVQLDHRRHAAGDALPSRHALPQKLERVVEEALRVGVGRYEAVELGVGIGGVGSVGEKERRADDGDKRRNPAGGVCGIKFRLVVVGRVVG